MFFNVIYFDENLMETYKSIMQPGKNVRYSTVQTNSKYGGELGIKGIKTDKSNDITFNGVLNESSNSKILLFEELISDSDFFMDFSFGDTQNSITDINKNMIIKVSMPLYIPEEFDNYEIIEQMKDKILDPSLFDIEKGHEDLFYNYFNFKDLKIPVYNSDNDKIFFGKLKKQFFEIESDDLDVLESDVTVLFRVKLEVKRPIEIFNPIKDLFTLPRSIRRSKEVRMDDNLKNIIFNDADGFEIDIIAIYY